jgi:intracellular septation protein A
MSSTLEFFRFYFLAGVYMAAGVLAVSAVVAMIEKTFGLNTTPRFNQIIQHRDTSNG